MSRMTTVLIGVSAIALIGIGVWWVNRVPTPSDSPHASNSGGQPGGSQAPPRYTNDLCVRVEQAGFKCPQLLAAPSVLDRGAIVQLRTLDDETPSDRVSIPTSWLLREPCLLPGATVPSTPDPEKTEATLPTSSFSFEGNLKAGTELRIPKIEGLELKAGPNVGRVRRVAVSAKKAWVLALGEDALANLIASCSLRKSCVDRVIKMQDRVVNNVLVAEGIEYSFYDGSDQKLSVNASLKNNVFSLGGSAGTVTVDDTKIASKVPVVVGVTFIRDQVITSVMPCDKDVLYTTNGTATVSASGGGGVGAIGAQPVVTRGIGDSAASKASGAEASECDAGFERTTSFADAVAMVAKGGSEDEIRFNGNFSLGGGHYATAAQCILGRPVDLSGHDTNINVVATWQGTISALVRYETGAQMTVSWGNMPTGATATVLGPSGQPATDSIGLGQSGERVVNLDGAGLYQVRTTLTINRTANGATRDSFNLAGYVRARIAPRSSAT